MKGAILVSAMDVLAVVLAPLLGVVGIFIGYALSSKREDRNIRRELSIQRYREGQALFDELIMAAGNRFTALQRWLWSVEDPSMYANRPVRDEYFVLVQQWNASTWSLRARLRIHLGDDAADRFLDYEDDRRPEPRSLHYQFVVAHSAVLAAEVDTSTVDEVQVRVDRLNHAWSSFADDIAVELAHRARLLSKPAVS